jgi:hypothetical protein
MGALALTVWFLFLLPPSRDASVFSYASILSLFPSFCSDVPFFFHIFIPFFFPFSHLFSFLFFIFSSPRREKGGYFSNVQSPAPLLSINDSKSSPLKTLLDIFVVNASVHRMRQACVGNRSHFQCRGTTLSNRVAQLWWLDRKQENRMLFQFLVTSYVGLSI